MGISGVFVTFLGIATGRGNDDESLPLRLPVAQRASFGVEVDADVISNFAPPNFRKVKPPEIGKEQISYLKTL